MMSDPMIGWSRKFESNATVTSNGSAVGLSEGVADTVGVKVLVGGTGETGVALGVGEGVAVWVRGANDARGLKKEGRSSATAAPTITTTTRIDVTTSRGVIIVLRDFFANNLMTLSVDKGPFRLTSSWKTGQSAYSLARHLAC
jgi:hypothetical protein